MKIFFATTEYITEKTKWDGGLAAYLGKISKSLSKEGHNISVFVVSDEDEDFDFNGIAVYRVKVPARKIIRYFKGLISSKYHVALNWVLQSYYIRKRMNEVIKRSSPPDIIQYSSCDGIGFFKVKNTPNVTRLSSWQPLFDKEYENDMVQSKYMSIVESRSVVYSNSVFAPSKRMADIVSRDKNINIEVIETPVDGSPGELDNAVYGKILQNKRYVLFFGTLGILKGGDVIADTIEEILRDNSDVFFVFAGKDFGFKNQPMIDHIIRKSGKYKNRVIYLGKLEKKELFPVIKNAELITLPSKIDNLPNAAIEAMSFGKIVVGTYEGGFDQLIDDSVDGFLFHVGDLKAFVEKVNNYLRLDEQSKMNLKSSVLKKIKRLNPEEIVKKHLEFYRRTIRRMKKTEKASMKELKTVILLMRNKCNARCIMCGLDYYGNRNDAEISLDKAKAIFSNLETRNVREIVFSGGGEPLLASDFIPVVKYAGTVYPDADLSIYTNGISLEGDKAEMVVQKFKRVTISINAATPDIYKKVVGVDAFDRVVSNVNKMVEMKNSLNSDIEIELSFVVSMININDVIPLVGLAKKIGVNSISVQYCRFYSSKIGCSDKSSSIEKKQAMYYNQEMSDNILRKASHIANREGVVFRMESLFSDKIDSVNCGFPGNTILVDPNGYIFPCGGGEVMFNNAVHSEKMNFGNLLNSNIEDIFKLPDYTTIKTCSEAPYDERAVAQCKNCNHTIKILGANNEKSHFIDVD